MKKRGRPTKYKEEYQEKLLVSARRNETIDRFCADIGINQDTYHEWVKVNPGFSEAHKDALTIRRANFLDKVYNCAFKPGSNPANNGMVYLIAYNLGIKCKPDEGDSDKNAEIAEVVREFISKLPG